MSKNTKTSLVYLLGILNSIAKIKKYSDSFSSPEKLYKANEQLNFNACLNLLANIGENANKIDNSLKKTYAEIEWQKIIGFRNRLVHDYQGLDIYIVYETIKSNLNELENLTLKILKKELANGNLSKEEYKLAKESNYYKLVDFSKIRLK